MSLSDLVRHFYHLFTNRVELTAEEAKSYPLKYRTDNLGWIFKHYGSNLIILNNLDEDDTEYVYRLIVRKLGMEPFDLSELSKKIWMYPNPISKEWREMGINQRTSTLCFVINTFIELDFHYDFTKREVPGFLQIAEEKIKYKLEQKEF